MFSHNFSDCNKSVLCYNSFYSTVMVVIALFNSLAEAVTLIDPLSGVDRKINIAFP